MSPLKKLILMIRGIPKTVIFNFRYFPFKDAMRFPFILSHRVALQKMGGKVELAEKARFNMIRIGFHENPQFDQKRERAVWNNRGKIVFKGKAYLGNGTRITNVGRPVIGNNFQASGNSTIFCRSDISFGDDCLISWGCTFMDGDAHGIFSLDSGERVNHDRPIRIGNHVWFGMNSTVLKGAEIGDGCVVAANSCVTRSMTQQNAVIGGYPLKVIRDRIRWEG